jgi:MFS family permease
MSDKSRQLVTILVCGSIILTLAMGVRHGLGLFLLPVTSEFGWNRGAFSFALAMQNLMWGIAQPFTGMIADRFGAGKVLIAGAILYAAGLAFMTASSSPLLFSVSAGVLIGIALSCCTFSVITGVIGRNFPAEKRSQALGISAAAGSFGQFLMVPFEQTLIEGIGWSNTLMLLAGMICLIIPLSAGLREKRVVAGARQQSIAQALREAFACPSFWLLTSGYFVCGFQVVFIGVHLPSFLRDRQLSAGVAVTALALIGLFNIFGTYAAGQLGARHTKKYLLSGIYTLRSVVIAIFLLLPITPLSVYIFAAAIGFLWLSTVPLTSGIVAHIFGVRYLSMLSGFVFFSHQMGSFCGVWLGGYLYDRTGSYNSVWMIAIALGIFAALINWPIREEPMARLAAAPAG